MHHLHDQKHSEHIAAHIINEIQLGEDTSPIDSIDNIPHPIGMVMHETAEEEPYGMPLDEGDDMTSEHFRLRRQSSSLVFDPSDVDKLILKEDEMVLQSDSGQVIKLKRGEDHSQENGLPVITDISVESPHSRRTTDNDMVSSSSSTSSLSHRLSACPARDMGIPQNRFQIISLHNRYLFNKQRYFTRYQAMEYWIQKGIITSRGEGTNLMYLLQSTGIVRNCNSRNSS